MENITTIIDCVEFKNNLHKKLYEKSGAKDFNEYIKYINSIYSDNQQPRPKGQHRGEEFTTNHTNF